MRWCGYVIWMSHLVDGWWMIDSGHARSDGRVRRTYAHTVRTYGSGFFLRLCIKDAAPYRVRGRAVCPHAAVSGLAARSTAAARTLARASAPRTAFGWGIRGRLALSCGHAGRVTLPCGYAGRGALGECTLLVLARRSASLPWRCLSISVDSDVSNEVFDVKIVNTVNKITTDIAFERILCYNRAEKEKKHAA